MTEINGETLPLTEITYFNFSLFNNLFNKDNNPLSSNELVTYLLIISPLNPL